MNLTFDIYRKGKCSSISFGINISVECRLRNGLNICNVGCSRQAGKKQVRETKKIEIWYSLDSGEFVNNLLLNCFIMRELWSFVFITCRCYVGHTFGGGVASLLERSFWETWKCYDLECLGFYLVHLGIMKYPYVWGVGSSYFGYETSLGVLLCYVEDGAFLYFVVSIERNKS